MSPCKVERLQSQLKQCNKFRSTSSRVDFDADPSASRSLGGENTEISSARSVSTVEARTPKDQAPSHPTNTPTSRRSRFIFGKAAGNISTNEGESEEEKSRGCARLLSNPKFEAAICLMIFANAVVFALESQNTGMAFGYNSFGEDYPGQCYALGPRVRFCWSQPCRCMEVS